MGWKGKKRKRNRIESDGATTTIHHTRHNQVGTNVLRAWRLVALHELPVGWGVVCVGV